jgi:autophagy-related protein 18
MIAGVIKRLVVCLEERIDIHNIRDMKVIHTIRDIPSNPRGLCALSTDNEKSYLAYPGSSQVGEVQIFDTINLVMVLLVLWIKEITKKIFFLKI